MALTATPTRSVRATLTRVLTLIQRSNSWCTGQDLHQEKDSQGKIRSAFCLRGAIRAAVGGSTAKANEEYLSTTRVAQATSRALVRTAKSNPKAYGLSPDFDSTGVVAINDYSGQTHAHVVRLVRDTLTNLG
jgi:hypothetical protein